MTIKRYLSGVILQTCIRAVQCTGLSVLIYQPLFNPYVSHRSRMRHHNPCARVAFLMKSMLCFISRIWIPIGGDLSHLRRDPRGISVY